MIDGRSVLGLVVARGGSKGLPRKNVRELCGRPLIAWTIDAARAATCLDAVVVTTDDAEIAEVARRYGAEVPFMRPAALATDTAASVDVVEHALETLAASGRRFDVVVLLEPTSPLREASDIDAAVRRLIESGAGSIVSVCRADVCHPAFMYRMGERETLLPFLPNQPGGVRRQDIEPLYYLEGTVYASTVDALKARRTFCHDQTIGYEVPKWKAIEIDDLDDFLMAAAIAQQKGLSK
jgi:N-acylneuraminate cytidylyltransferase/CMP-N,N'-diacetyllegionaminic acid synthase